MWFVYERVNSYDFEMAVMPNAAATCSVLPASLVSGGGSPRSFAILNGSKRAIS